MKHAAHRADEGTDRRPHAYLLQLFDDDTNQGRVAVRVVLNLLIECPPEHAFIYTDTDTQTHTHTHKHARTDTHAHTHINSKI